MKKSNDMTSDIEKIYYTTDELKKIVEDLGRQISIDYADKNLFLVSVLKGSVVFMADLMRSITIPCSIDFMAVSCYGKGTEPGDVQILKDLDQNLKGKDLLIVEDILDSGRTLSYLRKVLMVREPASIKICTLFDKPERREAKDIKADYVGVDVPNEFIVGYGLDFAEKYRNLPYIGVLKPEIYKN